MIDHSALEESAAGLEPRTRAKLNVYVNEAQFFAEFFAPTLSRLPAHARVIEIGSGVGLLSLMLAERGLRVEAFEPESSGFGEMQTLRDLILEAWRGPVPDITWRDVHLESANGTETVDLILAVHVLEHVQNWPELVDAALTHLSPRGLFKAVCPNYALPYEPHLEMPTLLNKDLTGRLMARRISRAPVDDVSDFWDELSWITAAQVRRFCRQRNLHFRLSPEASKAYVVRAQGDGDFAGRKPATLRRVAALAGPVIDIVPTQLLPLIDLTIGPQLRD